MLAKTVTIAENVCELLMRFEQVLVRVNGRVALMDLLPVIAKDWCWCQAFG